MVLPDRKLNENDLRAIQMLAGAKKFEQVVHWLGVAGCVIGSWLPLQAVRSMVSSLAGRTTKVDVAIVVGLTLTLAGGLLGEFVHNRYLRRTIKEKDLEIARLKAHIQRGAPDA